MLEKKIIIPFAEYNDLKSKETELNELLNNTPKILLRTIDDYQKGKEFYVFDKEAIEGVKKELLDIANEESIFIEDVQKKERVSFIKNLINHLK